MTADHERDPLPLSLIGWGVTLTMFVFGAWGYSMRAGLFDGETIGAALTPASAGWFVLAALSGIMQAGAAFGAKALRRSRNFKLDASKILSGVLVGGGATVTGIAIHNALEVAGMGPVEAFLIALGVPVCEFAVWWVDESLVSEATARRAADEEQRRQDAIERSKPREAPSPLDAASFDFASASDEAIERAISAAASIKKLGENERARRRTQKVNAR